MRTINIHAAKTRRSQLGGRAAAGVNVVSRNGKPLVRITQPEVARRAIRFDALKDRVEVPADFDARRPDAVLAGFEGR